MMSVTSSEKDLGVWITSKPDFTLHCDEASPKTMPCPGLIKRTFTQLTKESFLLLYKTYISSVCLFGICIQQRVTKLVAQLQYETRLQHQLDCILFIVVDKEEI